VLHEQARGGMAVIGILGSYGGLNTGDEAILTSMLASLRVARPGVGDEFVVFAGSNARRVSGGLRG
jgi:polysaccharide pyruvyl transferase WcaK-like protein